MTKTTSDAQALGEDGAHHSDAHSALRPFEEVMQLIRILDEDMPVQRLQVLLYVFTHPGCTSNDIASGVRMAQSSVSRNTATLGAKGWLNQKTKKRSPGLRLIEQRRDPCDPRRSVYYPTPIGDALSTVIVGKGDEMHRAVLQHG